jgi:hypothetical protein
MSGDPRDRTNMDRAESAALALDAYAKDCYGAPSGEETRDAVGDLLCDLRHLCDLYGVHFDDLVEGSAATHHAEIFGDAYADPEPANYGADPAQVWPR